MSVWEAADIKVGTKIETIKAVRGHRKLSFAEQQITSGKKFWFLPLNFLWRLILNLL